ncbi:MAG: hypothetical protein KA955_07230, partial [Prevotella sp.]|nr:hypothetical protein [Prevotella sp.]
VLNNYFLKLSLQVDFVTYFRNQLGVTIAKISQFFEQIDSILTSLFLYKICITMIFTTNI